jgi:uncharacterized protein YecA (UPF0149 family)
VDDSDQATAFIAEREAELARRQRTLDERERNIEIGERRLRAMTQRQTTLATPKVVPELVKVGRNDACPCGSGVKYKRCHGG